MNTPTLLEKALHAAFAACLTTASCLAAPGTKPPPLSGNAPTSAPETPAASRVLDIPTGPSRFIIQFEEAPLALYSGSDAEFAAPSRTIRAGRSRLDVQGSAARNYVAHLSALQHDRLADLSASLGRSVVTHFQFQHALNAVVVTLAPEELSKIATIDGVASIRPDLMQTTSSDIGPGFIGAGNAWWGSQAGQDSFFASGFDTTGGVRGEGVVVGVVDTGYNSASPSFAATDDFGYTIENPLGTGQFLGHCAVEGISTAGCNDKVIGVYDFVSELLGEPLSVEDIDGHGSHTAGTAAGNQRKIHGYTGQMAGVAPRANLVIYRSCHTNACFESSLTSAFDQAIQDSVVDVMNFSITGGTDPWNDPVSLAMLSATESGIFVSTAAGNGEPIAGSVNHVGPWTTTVAAGTHTGAYALHTASVSGENTIGTVYAMPAQYAKSADGGLASLARKSPTFDSDNDGCEAFPAGTFDGVMAIVKAGFTCNDDEIAANAVQAGANSILMVGYNELLYVAFPFTSVPVFGTDDAAGKAIADYVDANPGETVQIGALFRLAEMPDVLANFSLVGPASFDVIKPDVQAPGQNILAAIAGDGTPEGAEAVGLKSGTSMASPHIAGAAALVRDAHPEWTPSEVKSALMMSSRKSGLRKPDQVSASDAFDRGAGRIRVDHALKAGLVLDESGLAYLAADPLDGGDPATLNIASLTQAACITVTGIDTSEPRCMFKREVRNTTNRTVQWSAEFVGLVGTVSPDTFSIGPHDSRSLEITVDATAIPADGAYRFGDLVLTSSDESLFPLRLPAAVRIPRPNLSTSTSMDIVFTGDTGEQTLEILNSGGSTLSISQTNLFDDSPAHPIVVIDQQEAGEEGHLYLSTYGNTIDRGNYISDDFWITDSGATDLDYLFMRGGVGFFVDFESNPFIIYPGLTPLEELVGQNIQLAIYADENGVPAGGPPLAPTPNNPPIWSFTAVIGSTPGLNLEGDDIALDLQLAAAPPTQLPAGRYWLVVYVEEDIYTQGIWAAASSKASGDSILAVLSTIGSSPMGAWSNGEGLFAGLGVDGLQMRIEDRVACGAPWLSTSPASADLQGLIGLPLTVAIDATLFPPNETSAAAYLCLESNDPDTPVTVVRVNATQQN
jgi:subtilisin family serine protease